MTTDPHEEIKNRIYHMIFELEEVMDQHRAVKTSLQDETSHKLKFARKYMYEAALAISDTIKDQQTN